MGEALRNRPAIDLASVVTASALLLGASGVIVVMLGLGRHGPPARRLVSVLSEIASYEAEQSPEVLAGAFGAFAGWARARKPIMRLEGELADLAAQGSAADAAQADRVRAALTSWRSSIDRAYADGAPNDQLEAVSAELRSLLAAQP